MQYGFRKVLATTLGASIITVSALGLGCNDNNDYQGPKPTNTPVATETPKPSPTPINWKSYMKDRGVVASENFVLHTDEHAGAYVFVVRRDDGTERVYSAKADGESDIGNIKLDTLLNLGDEVEIYVFDRKFEDDKETQEFLRSSGAYYISNESTYNDRLYVVKVPK